MYCSLSKTQSLPMVTIIRVSSHHFTGLSPVQAPKILSFSNRVYPKPSLTPGNCVFDAQTRVLLNKNRKIGFNFGGFGAEMKVVRSFSTAYDAGFRDGKDLPWLDGSSEVEKPRTEARTRTRARTRAVGKGKASGSSVGKSSWEISAEKFIEKNGGVVVKDEGTGMGTEDVWRKPRVTRVRRDEEEIRAVDDWRNPDFKGDEESEDDDDGEDEVKDSRWGKIKSRAGRMMDSVRVGNDRPEVRKWNREENWGRKTYRDATESTVPKMVGEGLYGVGPVLAALSAGRREFYALYVQEGLELSKNNRKRKDKKGFEKVLRIAEKLGLTLREVSKHDLNMVADNRPHQGLVLDTSPLEMVNIKELENASLEHDKGVLWVALDEVTDPQNLGAIVRSSYFFGATGVVLCAKNSAPLSGVVSKASAGSLELMELRSCKNMMQFLTSSAKNGWRVVGGSVSKRAVPLREVAPGAPTILVLGSEGTGLRPLVERSCSQLVKIPGNIPVDVTSERYADDEDDDEDSPVEEPESSKEEFQSFMAVESLNVSVAAGVLLHHFIGGNYTSSNLLGNAGNNELE